MRVSANARRGRYLDKPLGSEWFPGVPPELRRRVAIRVIAFMVVVGGVGVALGIWLVSHAQ